MTSKMSQYSSIPETLKFFSLSCLEFSKDQIIESKNEIVIEESLSIFINGYHYATALITPHMKNEYIIGHLFSEGIIKSLENIKSIGMNGNVVNVLIENYGKTKVLIPKKLIVSGCGSSSSFLDESKLPKVSSTKEVSGKIIIESFKEVLKSELYKKTRGTHTCAIFDESLSSFAEDIGRHNALDKIIGDALIKKYNFQNTFVLTTGRISSEMVLKCARANIPIIASKTSVTSLAINIANKVGLTIIGFATGSGFKVFTHYYRALNTSPVGG